MSSPKDIIYLKHIVACVREVHSYTDGRLSDLHEHPMAWDATIRKLQILSESAMRISDEQKAHMPNVEWYKIKGFRNVLVHEYLGDIDPLIVQKVITDYLPVLQQECNNRLKEIED